MKIGIKMAVVGALLGVSSISAWADSQTNLVRSLNIQLSGYEQGDSSTSKNTTTTAVNAISIANADVINAIGLVSGNNFSTNAILVVITPVPSGSSSIVIRDGGNSFKVNEFFNQNILSDVVGKSTENSKTGKASGSNYSLQEFALVDWGWYGALPVHYDVTGLTVEDFSIPAIPGPRSELKAKVSGTGDLNGNLVILDGTISVTGQTVEVVINNNPPPS